MLIDALADAADCGMCNATGKMVITGEGQERPYDPNADTGTHPEDISICEFCLDNGRFVPPCLYQKFKHDIIANLAHDAWTLTRAEVMAWLDQHNQKG